MVELLLLDELVNFIAAKTQDYLLDTRLGQRPPTIISGFLPPKRDGDADIDEEYCILVRIVDGEDDWNAVQDQVNAIVRTLIIVRTASMDVQAGPRNTLNLMQRIQREIYATPILANRYRATFPLKWKAPEGNTLPIWQGEMTIPWIVPAPQEIFDMTGGDCFG